MTKLESQVKSVSINNKEYPLNSLYFTFNETAETLELRNCYTDERISNGTYSEYKNDSNVPYASLSALITAVRGMIFA